MKFLRKFNEHTSYEAEVNSVGVDISLPNVSYCEDVKDVHYTPYNLVRFYVGEITEPQTVRISTDLITSVDVQVSTGNKWYSYLLPKGKGLCAINGTVNKVVVKADIKTTNNIIIPSSTVEASFKGSNTSNLTSTTIMFSSCSGLTSLDLSGWDISKVTDMNRMFDGCTRLTSLNLSGWDMSNVTDMSGMFGSCSNSLKIRMVGCSPETVGKIQNQLTADGITGAQITT